MALIRCLSTCFSDIQAVVFDKDGTLAQSEPYLRQLAQQRARLIDAQVPGVETPLLLAFGLEGEQINPTGLMAVGTRLENEIAAAAYVAETGRGWVAAQNLVKTAFIEANIPNKAQQTPLVEGALSCLQRLAQAGCKLALLSSDSRANVIEFVEQYDLNLLFQAVYGVDEHFTRKSDPDLLAQLSSTLAVPWTQMVIIGDSEFDMQIAREVGMAGCIGFTGGWSLPVPALSADAIIHDWGQLQAE